ncbi:MULTISPECIES: DEAD/DEAH box helicase [Aequorivita]|uniref:DEAD/DEAH box helicase n=1 Tax=Aequorivita iocasae TaxID=2803865 RepID=A0ABX7DW12_9FLAO|nr:MULTISPECIES: DEAD/DEAH box helicase [Aequorivita]QQX77786.1 DEAD/DEAH box helicase [Aequorivita iocasae]UCA57286.1 DEAD/DEAH box helicase [Aequorivita sp. F7]
MTKQKSIPTVTVSYKGTGNSIKSNELGMREMQERAYEKRGEQYLLIKSPPASGKSRALMFIALDKLNSQGIKQAIIAVPEKSIGSSFANEQLTKYGFHYDWFVQPKWNLCNSPGEDGSKVNSVKTFLESGDEVLVCTHATFRFAVERFGVDVFDDRLIAIDEFHHVSADDNNVLGTQLKDLISRDRAHIVAMTGSYFRGDANPVLMPEDESKFETVTYTYYEQLNGYEYLKTLNIGYYFYSEAYSDAILNVLNPNEKTIIHIPNVNSRESTGQKIKEVEHIIDQLGEWLGVDPDTGFHLVKTKEGKIIKIADLVDDDVLKRSRVQAALRLPDIKTNRDHVDIIIALGMAKEGFDWIWCEHALTIGYRSSLTEIVQIIGRATRDAPHKIQTRFTNLIAEVEASEEAVTDAVNDTLKAISASLLMEQVLTPRFNFTPKNPQSGPLEGVDYGEGGYNPDKENIGFNEETGQYEVEIKGLSMPKSESAQRICKEDLNEVIAAFAQDKEALGRGLFDEELVPQELTQIRMGKIIKEKYPEIDDEEREAIRQFAIAALNLTQMGKKALNASDELKNQANTSLIDGVRKFTMDVRDLDVDWIDSINPFSEAYAILSKAMTEKSLKAMAEVISGRKPNISLEEARELAKRALKFKNERGRLPDIKSADPWEQRMAQGIAFLARKKYEEQNG